MPFDPEGIGYDYDTAKRYGIRPDSAGHWPSREPKTGQLLKGRGHPTYDKTLEAEKRLGYTVVKGRGGKYYSTKKKSRTAKQLKDIGN